MKIMAQLIREKKAPAEVMAMLREKESDVLSSLPGIRKAPRTKRRRH